MSVKVEENENLYPANCMVGNFWHFNEDEKTLVAHHMDKVVEEIDEPLRDYLTRLMFCPHILPIFSCWGHLKELNQIDNDGYILFRSKFYPTEVIEKIIIPLQTQVCKELDYFTPEFSTSTWHTIGIDKIGYNISWSRFLKEENKHYLLKTLCEICEV